MTAATAMCPMPRFVDTPLLSIGYDEWNPSGQRTAVLLHGWPDSPRCWAGVAPVLAAAGWRVLTPALRGFAPTRFRHDATPRTGQLAALGCDLLDFIDALGLKQPALVGHDWGARAVANASGLRPGVASHLVMLSVGYGTNSSDQPLAPEQAQRYWYHWYMATERGRQAVQEDRRAFARQMWDSWAPAGWYDPAEFEATADAFDNADWPSITLHSYTHRWGNAAGDPAYAEADARLTPAPVLSVPTLVLHGGDDRVGPAPMSAGKERFFTGRYERQVLPGIGHFPQREAPQAVAEALLRFLNA